MVAGNPDPADAPDAPTSGSNRGAFAAALASCDLATRQRLLAIVADGSYVTPRVLIGPVPPTTTTVERATQPEPTQQVTTD